MKKIMFALLIIICFSTKAQQVSQLNDFGRIAINSYIGNQVKIPIEAKNNLETKLKQIVSNYGMGGTSVNARFIVTANISVVSKDIVAGPPQMIAQNMDITLFVGDAIENKVFANTIITTKGVGTNENKAFIDAIKQMNTKNKIMQMFLDEAKNKIISYYSSQCDFIQINAESLKKQGKYDEAIYSLALVPEVCKECYTRSLNEMGIIYELKVDSEGKALLDKAISTWAVKPNEEGAQEARNYIMQINPVAKCINDASRLLKTMNNKVIADEKERLKREDEFKNRQHELILANSNQKAELEKQRINAYREVAVEFVKTIPVILNIKNINW